MKFLVKFLGDEKRDGFTFTEQQDKMDAWFSLERDRDEEDKAVVFTRARCDKRTTRFAPSSIPSTPGETCSTSFKCSTDCIIRRSTTARPIKT
jgi:hypothetical protein